VATRERPKLWFDAQGRMTHLLNGVCSAENCVRPASTVRGLQVRELHFGRTTRCSTMSECRKSLQFVGACAVSTYSLHTGRVYILKICIHLFMSTLQRDTSTGRAVSLSLSPRCRSIHRHIFVSSRYPDVEPRCYTNASLGKLVDADWPAVV
jgi:hypothetical protein